MWWLLAKMGFQFAIDRVQAAADANAKKVAADTAAGDKIRAEGDAEANADREKDQP